MQKVSEVTGPAAEAAYYVLWSNDLQCFKLVWNEADNLGTGVITYSISKKIFIISIAKSP